MTLTVKRTKIPRMVKFSVSGLRGVIGSDFHAGDFLLISKGFARFMKARTVLLARDARTSGAKIHDAVQAGLMGAGVQVLETGMVTTPTAVFGTKEFNADAGVVITASHNPPDQNGLKFLQQGRVLTPARSKEFIDFLNEKPQVSDGTQGWSKRISAGASHLNALLDIFPQVARKPRLRVGLDPVNGAAGPEAKQILEALNCEVFSVNFEPDGRFGRGGEPVPENITALASLVKEEQLDAGFAFDPDGDRLAFVDEGGRAPGEEYTLPLCCRWALEQDKRDVAVNLSTSRLIESVAAQFDVTVHRTPVGEAYVVDKLIEISGSCGGEGNGGFILPKLNATRDGLLAMAVLVQMKRSFGSLSDMVDALPVYHRSKDKLTIPWSEDLIDKITSLYPSASRNDTDGLWLGKEAFWVHVRPSNTEPVVRVLVEADSAEICSKIAKQVRKICVE